MLSNELISKLVNQNLSLEITPKLVSAINDTPCPTISNVFSQLTAVQVIGKEEFNDLLILMAKKDFVLIECMDGVELVRLNCERIEKLVYKTFLVDFIRQAHGEMYSIVIDYFFINSFASKQQFLNDYLLFIKTFHQEKDLASTTAQSAFDQLEQQELLIDYTNPKIKIDHGVEALNEYKCLNFKKMVSLIRTSLIMKYCSSIYPSRIVSLISVLLSASGLYNRASVVKKTEKLSVETLKRTILTKNPNLLHELNADKLVEEIGPINHEVVIFDIDSKEICLDLEYAVNCIKVEILEHFIGTFFSPNHNRLIRAIILLKLNNLKALEDNVLIKKNELRSILLDLEELNVIRKVYLGLNSSEVYYESNISEFAEKVCLKYFKIIENMLQVRDRVIEPRGATLDDDESYIRTCKLELAVKQIAEKLLILREF